MVETQVQNAGRVLVGATEVAKKKAVNLNQKRAKDAQLVKGRFNYFEVPGGTLSFVFRAYKGDPVVRYDLQDGEIYSIPLGVARHLNNDVGRYEHSYLLDKNGQPSTLAKKRIRRCNFENLEFMDIEDIGTKYIDEVTTTELPPLTK